MMTLEHFFEPQGPIEQPNIKKFDQTKLLKAYERQCRIFDKDAESDKKCKLYIFLLFIFGLMKK
jgi:hypothetical protein